MRFLVYGTLTPAVADALKRHEHTPLSPAELGLTDTAPPEVLKLAQSKQLDIVTNDEALARQPFESDAVFNRVIVLLKLEGQDVEQDDAIDRLFERYKRLTPGRLYTVTGTRVKIRQLPGKR